MLTLRNRRLATTVVSVLLGIIVLTGCGRQREVVAPGQITVGRFDTVLVVPNQPNEQFVRIDQQGTVLTYGGRLNGVPNGHFKFTAVNDGSAEIVVSENGGLTTVHVMVTN